jgi:hypothetical protein
MASHAVVILTPVLGQCCSWQNRHRGSRFEAKQWHDSEWEQTIALWLGCQRALAAEPARHSRLELGHGRVPRVGPAAPGIKTGGVTRPLVPAWSPWPLFSWLAPKSRQHHSPYLQCLLHHLSSSYCLRNTCCALDDSPSGEHLHVIYRC